MVGAAFSACFQVIVPLMKPAISTFDLTFLHSWNELLFAQILINNQGSQNINSGINRWWASILPLGVLFARHWPFSIPIIAYLFMSKQVQQSMIAGSSQTIKQVKIMEPILDVAHLNTILR